MAFDFKRCASELYSAIKEQSNIVSVAHCATRLRLVLSDDNLDIKKIENCYGVKGVFFNNGQLHVIIGAGIVDDVYDAFLKISGVSGVSKEEIKALAVEKQPVFKRLIKTLGDVFIPILPAIVASGLMMGLVEALARAIPSFSESDWFGLLDMIANTAFVFLPILIAISSAKVFGGNPYLGAVIGMIMIHPNLVNAWSVSSLNNEIPTWHLFGSISISQIGYQGHVIPVVIAVWIMCKIEKILHKRVPQMIDLFVTPLCTVIITAFLTLGIIGPVFSIAENHILIFAKWIITVGYGIGAMIMGAVYPVTVVFGIHHMYNVIEAGMLSELGGVNTWMPIASAANFAQAAACLAVGIKAKNVKTKSVAIPSALSAALGITEPAIFGINIRYMKPFICAMIGGAVGSIAGAILHVGASAYGVTGIPGILITLDCFFEYAIMLCVSAVVAFILTWITWKEGTYSNNKNDNEEDPLIIASPVKGEKISLLEIEDATFSSGILGNGFGIIPKEGVIYAPFDGVVSMIADTKHAIGLTSVDGVELLIHIGIDTIKLDGAGFDSQVICNQRVNKGDVILEFDIDLIKKKGLDSTCVVIVTNEEQCEKLIEFE